MNNFKRLFSIYKELFFLRSYARVNIYKTQRWLTLPLASQANKNYELDENRDLGLVYLPAMIYKINYFEN
jgi:hypothetical protein